jgi:type I restriction enzyme S subunit
VNWIDTVWGNICTLTYGKAIKGYQQLTEGYPVYGTNGKIGFWETALQSEPGVIVGRKGAYRGVEFSPSPFYVIDTAYALKPMKGLDARWAYYCLLGADINSMDSGSAIPSTSRDEFYAMPVALPPLSEQRDIAAILGALDDKIELNRKTAATLEAMARALYRSWFVDFDPVWAKTEGRTPAHMDEATAALFPDSFGDDGLPVGWRKEALAKHLNVDRGLSYKGDHLCEEGDGLPMHNLNSIFEGGGYKADGIKYYAGDFRPRHKIHPGDLIVANTEQGFDLRLIGHAALVPHYFGPTGLFSQHIYRVSAKKDSAFSNEWLYLMLTVTALGQEIRGYSNGTTVNMLPVDAFEVPEVAVPSTGVMENFTKTVRPMFSRQEELQEENQTLTALRDTLLPKLMSGELRVREAQELVEEVA